MRFLKRPRDSRATRRYRKLLAEAFPMKNEDIPMNDGTGLTGEGFFSQGRWKARVANRRKFRVEVSGNRKWILIGVAVVAVCGTIIYLSVTYGGSIAGLLR